MSKQHPGVRAAILAATAACTDPLGITMKGLREATGFTGVQITSQATDLRHAGLLFALVHHHDSRFFVSAEQCDRAAPAVAAYVKALRDASKARIRAGWKARADAKAAAKRAARPPKEAKPKPATAKPKRTAFVKPEQPKPFNKAPEARKKWADQVPIVPEHVKVQRCPGFSGVSPFKPDAGFCGDFLKAGVGRYLEPCGHIGSVYERA